MNEVQQTLLTGAGRQWEAALVSQFAAWAGDIPRPFPASK